MDQIIYVCVGLNGDYLGTFSSRKLAEDSWKLTWSSETDDLSFDTYAGGWHVHVRATNVGRILCEVVQGKVACL